MSALTQQQESALNNFVALTQADKEVATQFLKACAWSVDTAISRFYDYNGDVKKLAPQNPQPMIPNIQQPNNNNNSQQNIFQNLMQQMSSAFYQQPQRQNIPQNNNNNINANDFIDLQNDNGLYGNQQPLIRKADNYYTEQLVAGPVNQYGSDYYKQKKDNMANFSKEWTKGKKTKKTDQLAKLFSDPDYKFRGDWSLAKQNGVNKNLWILCNIQSTSNFVSHCLNRDVFNDNELSQIIKNNFIFYQWSNNTDNAKKLQALYQKYNVPCLFIVDPNTGLDCYTFYIPDQPDKVIILKNKIMEFIEKYPDPSKKPKEQPVDDKKIDNTPNEDKEMQKAIAASLEDNDAEWGDEDENQEDWNEDELDDNEINTDAMDIDNINNNKTTQKDDKKTDIGDDINNNNKQIKKDNTPKYQLSDEPDKNDKDSTGIRLRLPGKMVTRRFKKSTKVGELYQWVIESMENPKEFSLMQQMPRIKLDDKEKTLNDLKLFNTTINYHEL